MRLSDLLGQPVTDQHGRRWGKIHDAHLVQDGPLLVSGSAAFRLHGVIAGKGSIGTRLGYTDREGRSTERLTRGPLPIRAFVRRLHHDAVYIPWTAVRLVDADRVLVVAPPQGFSPPA